MDPSLVWNGPKTFSFGGPIYMHDGKGILFLKFLWDDDETYEYFIAGSHVWREHNDNDNISIQMSLLVIFFHLSWYLGMWNSN